MSIKEWPEGSGRVRSCWVQRGGVDDAELLAILLRVGTRGHERG